MRIRLSNLAALTIFAIFLSPTYSHAGIGIIGLSSLTVAADFYNNSPQENRDLARAICNASNVPSYQCNTSRIGKAICISGGRASFECGVSPSIGKGLCMAGGRASFECGTNPSVGKGICMAGGRASFECGTNPSVGKGICMAGGRASFECPSSLTPAAGLCMAKGHPSFTCRSISREQSISLDIIDREWAWDEFFDAYGRITWRCRGKLSGRFADDYRCYGSPKIDNTWPRK